MKVFPKLGFFEGKKNLFLTHAGADIDSVCSAAALFFSLKKNSVCAIGVPEHISLAAKTLCEKLEIPFFVNPKNISDFDNIFFLDFNSPQMLGTLFAEIDFSKNIFLIDHHQKTANSLLEKSTHIVDEKAASCTEVVFSYLEESGIKISKKVAQFIACGIIVDSGKFSTASEKTFGIMGKMVAKSGLPYTDFFSLFEVKPDVSERVARLKAARRARFFKSFDKIISISDVKAFESSSAMSLVFLGSDVAFSGGEKNGKILISARALNSFVSETGFDLVKNVFVPLSEKFFGNGGGHPAAAAFNGTGFLLEPALLECVKLVNVFLEKKNAKKSGFKEYD